MRYRLDSSWRRPNKGNTVIAGSPLRVFRLSDAGQRFIATIEAGGEVDATSAQQKLLDRLVDAGALHPLPIVGRLTSNDVTIVMPAFLTGVSCTFSGTKPPQAIVVDDGSTPPLAGASIRHDTNRGPGAARNAGLEHVTTPFVAFVDSDVTLSDDWLDALLPHFDDDNVALVAPRVASTPGTTRLARYEQRYSPLDLGTQPARIEAGTRVSYVPAATIVCRTDAIRAIGGFDETLRTGEDVDLVWRLRKAGHRCRYEPSSVVHHQPRASLAAMLRQRFGFGRSAAPLAARHPGALGPVRLSPWSALAWLLVLARRPFLAASVVAGTIVALHRKLRDVPPIESARLAGLGTLAAGRQLADATTRVWWPIAAVIALFSRRARLPIAAAVVAAGPIQLLDRMAYGAGVWAGVVDEGDLTALLPVILAHSSHTDSGTTPQRIN